METVKSKLDGLGDALQKGANRVLAWLFENALNDDAIWEDIVSRLLELANRTIPEIIEEIRTFMRNVLTEEEEKPDEFNTEDETPDGDQGTDESGRWEERQSAQESSDLVDKERGNR